MPSAAKQIAIVGAGLVGSLMAIYLARRGHRVTLYERRGDMRKNVVDAGRSINLALSNRGIRALEEVGLADEIKKAAIPMNGRAMHDVHGNLSFLPYGKEGQFINSISRTALNVILLNAAEEAGARVEFNLRCLHADEHTTTLTFATDSGEKKVTHDLIIGADGSWSAVRTALQHNDRFSYSQSFIDHGYKEFHIPPGAGATFVLEKNALHIWPRQSFMMIALPNPDGSFTGTLFFPWEGEKSFQSLTETRQITDFFETVFPDFAALAPDYLHDFRTNPTGSLATIQCWPWRKNKILLIGDAAHGIVPFYGQGMNAGFEDCRILNNLLQEKQENWDDALAEFEHLRKPDTDAIAKLALDNFIEMRDLVADADFLLRKKIEAQLNVRYPDQWIPLYSMVTFHSNIRYSEALATGIRQKKIMDDVMKLPGIAERWATMDFQAIVDRLHAPS